MELTDLRYFVAVADHLHFAKAAATQKITQPPLSRRIQHLERELGTPLFWRAHKWKVSLTKAGETLLPEARRILRQTDFKDPLPQRGRLRRDRAICERGDLRDAEQERCPWFRAGNALPLS